MTIAQDFASKAAIAFVAVAMLFTMTVPSAKAQSSEDMQKMINDLLAQISALQGQGGTSSSVASGICPFTWTRDLKTGASGADVMKLQQFLNSNADTRVSASGVGSVGMETEFFGPATAAAVSKFQVMHRADVLTPAGLTNPTGYFGPGTRAKANSLCTTAPVVDGEDDEDTDTESGDLSGEASLDTLTIDSASDDEVEEGAEDAEIATVNVEFTDGDASISRLDVTLGSVTAGDVWDVLDTVTLWVDGEEVASMDASDEDEYQDTTNASGTIRFSGLDIVAMEDEELEIVIAATVQSSVDSGDQGVIEVSVDTIRYFDADGVATTEDDASAGVDLLETVDFTVAEAGIDDELIVKTSTSDPDGSTLQVEDDSKSDFMNVFIFDLDTDDSVNDIELNEVAVTVSVSTGTVASVVDDAELVIDGVTIDDFVVAVVSATTSTYTFDVDGDVTIDAGDRVAAELNLKFKALAIEGTTVRASVTTAQANAIVAEGAEDLDNTSPDQLMGSATGDVHTLRTAGVDVSIDSVESDVESQDGTTNDYATYVVSVDVTAFEQDAYIAIDESLSFLFSLETAAGAPVTVGTSTAVLTSTGDEQGAYFLVNEGETETFTLTVTYVPGVANTQARVQLDSIEFADTEAAADQSWTASPDTDYRTGVETIVN